MSKMKKLSCLLGIMITLLLVGGMLVLSGRAASAAAREESLGFEEAAGADAGLEMDYTSPLLERLLDWSVPEGDPAEGHLLTALPGHEFSDQTVSIEDGETPAEESGDPDPDAKGENSEDDPTEEADEPETPAYTCQEERRTVYAEKGMYVRSGPSMDYEVVGYYAAGSAISVNGRCTETGWWRISYRGETAFVSDKITSLESICTAAQTKVSTSVTSEDPDSSLDSTSGGTSGASSYNGICVGDTISGQATFYCACAKCTGTGDGITASGKKVSNGMSLSPGIVACNWLPLGSRISVDGTEYEVADRGGSAMNAIGRIDIFVPEGHSAALARGRQCVTITLLSLP